jgi:hypothetical protein
MLAALLVVAAVTSVTFGIVALRGTNTSAPATTASASPEPTASASTPSPSFAVATPAASPLAWAGPVRPDASAMPVLAMNGPTLCVADNSYSWTDALDAPVGFVDIVGTSRPTRLHSTRADTSIAIAVKPPFASALDATEALIQYGAVFDTDQDRTPDYELGINNSVGGGSYRVWVTNLRTGETDEQLGPPYGAPFDFVHPDEQEPSESGAVSMRFWFLGDLPWPADADYRYYAWSSYTENGTVAAWDYAPDFGWLGLEPCESVSDSGWPSTTRNTAGIYSWNGSTCAGSNCSGLSATSAWMHNGYGTGDVEIALELLPRPVVPEEGKNPTYHEIAGHWALYRRADTGHEEWDIDLDGRTLAIRLTARPGTSQGDLDDAHAIIESMRYDPEDSTLGFRLTFILSNDEWNS